jgi:hypothetical protein
MALGRRSGSGIAAHQAAVVRFEAWVVLEVHSESPQMFEDCSGVLEDGGWFLEDSFGTRTE